MIDANEAYLCAAETAASGKCEAACEVHVGAVCLVHVAQWGYFSYCEEAISEDERRGLTVTKEPS